MRKLCAFVAGCFFFFLVGRSWGAEKIRVAFTAPSPTQSPPWIAKETGIFSKYGLDAEVIMLSGSPRLVQSLIAGDVDYAHVGATATMRARMRGADVVILATTTNISNQKLVVNPKSGIHRLEDLKGKVVGVAQYGSEGDIFTRIVISKAGLRPDKDVGILQLGGTPQVAAALMAGGIEAGVFGGLASVTVQKSGAVVLTSGVELNIFALSQPVVTTKRNIQRNRDSVMRFIRAYVEAFRYFKTNREGTIPILQKLMGRITREQASIVYDDVADLFEDLPVPREKALQAALDRESDPIARTFKPADFIDLSFLKQIDRSGLVEKLYRK